MVARVTQRLVADHPEMPPAEVVSSLNTVGNATRQRNAIMTKLLDGKTDPAADPWSVLDSMPAPALSAATQRQQDDRQHVQGAENAAGEAVGVQGGPLP